MLESREISNDVSSTTRCIGQPPVVHLLSDDAGEENRDPKPLPAGGNGIRRNSTRELDLSECGMWECTEDQTAVAALLQSTGELLQSNAPSYVREWLDDALRASQGPRWKAAHAISQLYDSSEKATRAGYAAASNMVEQFTGAIHDVVGESLPTTQPDDQVKATKAYVAARNIAERFGYALDENGDDFPTKTQPTASLPHFPALPRLMRRASSLEAFRYSY